MTDIENQGRLNLQQAKLLFASGDPAASIALFDLAEEQLHDPSIARLSRGAARMAIGQYLQAENDFSLVLDRDRANERAWYYRGIARVALGRYQEGIDDLTVSLSRNNDRGIAHLVRGLAYAELGNRTDALLDLNGAEAFSDAEIASFKRLFGNSGNPFLNTKSLLARDNAPWNRMLSRDSAARLKTLLER